MFHSKEVPYFVIPLLVGIYIATHFPLLQTTNVYKSLYIYDHERV